MNNLKDYIDFVLKAADAIQPLLRKHFGKPTVLDYLVGYFGIRDDRLYRGSWPIFFLLNMVK